MIKEPLALNTLTITGKSFLDKKLVIVLLACSVHCGYEFMSWNQNNRSFLWVSITLDRLML